MSPLDCPTCDGRNYLVCRECGAHYLTILRPEYDDGLCFECTEVPA